MVIIGFHHKLSLKYLNQMKKKYYIISLIIIYNLYILLMKILIYKINIYNNLQINYTIVINKCMKEEEVY